MPTTFTPSMNASSQIKRLADELYWCTLERYVADDVGVLRGGNELVSFYTRPTGSDAVSLAADLNRIIDPLRKKRVQELLAQLRETIAQLERTDY